MSVLIISASPDVHAQAVARELTARGADFHLLDLSDFPTRLRLTMTYGAGGHAARLDHADGTSIDLSAVTGIWWRRPQPFGFPPTMRDPAARQFAFSETNTAFHGLYQSLAARWINEPGRDVTAGHKPYQLKVAQDVGLTIPETLITNDPAEARAFWRTYPGEVIHKQFVGLPDTVRETRRVVTLDERHADAIAFAPVLFQRHVAAVAETRAVIVGDEVFAGSTDLAALSQPQDVRSRQDAPYVAEHLPDAVTSALRAMMARLGLVYGAVDLRRRPDGEYVFLEINPAGQFLYIELETGQPIAAAMATALLA